MENIVANNEKPSISPAKILPLNENGRDDDEEMPDEQQQQMMEGVATTTEDVGDAEEEFGAAGSTPKYLTRRFIKKISPINNVKKVAESSTVGTTPTIDVKNVKIVRATVTQAPMADTNPIIKIQKKRGRKKKIITNNNNTNNDQQIRRKRGRPRKVHIEENNDNTTSLSQSESTSSSTDAATPNPNNLSTNETSKKTMKMGNQQKQQTPQNQTIFPAILPPTTTISTTTTTTHGNQNNKNLNLNNNFNMGVAAHYWAEFPIPLQKTMTTTEKDAEKKEEEEEDEADKLPKKLSKKELDAIRFAGINPLIVLCEAATLKQQEQANDVGKIPLQNGHDYGQQEAPVFSNSSSSSPSITNSNNNKKRYKCTESDSWELTCQYRIRTMSSIEARDHLTIACLNALCNGEKLARMRVLMSKKKLEKKKEGSNASMDNNNGEDDDVPFNFSLPKACLKLLTPAAIESLVEVVYEWINHHWIRTIDGRLGVELRQFSRIDQMRWILMYAVPQLCIYYLKKVNKISVDEAKQQFLAME